MAHTSTQNMPQRHSARCPHVLPNIFWFLICDGVLRRYMYEFLQLLAPHLNKRLVDRASNTQSQEDVDALFTEIELPKR